MDLDGRGRPETYVWAHKPHGAGGSGWIRRSSLVRPPRIERDARNPRPPGVSRNPLVIDADRGRTQLKGLRFLNSMRQFAKSGGNLGIHYAGRRPGEFDYIYLLSAVPNVVWGGVAKDSLIDGSHFIQAIDEEGRPIKETMTMYRGRDLDQPVPVTFVYGRAPRSRSYGWIARANVGSL